MSRAVDITVAAALIVLLGPSLLLIQAASAVGGESVQRGLRRLKLDNLPLLYRVLQGRLTVREWWRLVS